MPVEPERLRGVAVATLALALLGGTTAAFAVTAVLKLERSPVTAPRFTKHFSPGCECPRPGAVLALRLRRADTVDAAIVDSGGEVVRILVEDERRPRGPVTFQWDGRDDAGRRVADGHYRLRLRLADQHRTIVIPNPVFVDTRPPRVRLVEVEPLAFSPDEDGRRDRVRLLYTASEPARGTLLVAGEPARVGKLRGEGRRSMVWDGAVLGRALEPGTYELSLLVTDRAGNASEPTEAVVARLRYVEVVPAFLRVVRGGRLRFRVDTDAESFTWTLRGRRGSLSRRAGTSKRVMVELPRRLRAGRYLLRVTAGGHSGLATVRIVRRTT